MSYPSFLLILAGVPITVALTVLTLLVGAILGFPLMLARQSPILAVNALAGALISVIRAIPPIVWLFIVFFGIGASLPAISPFQATLAVLGAIATVNMAEIYRGAMRSIHHGQWEAAAALNFSRFRTFTDIIIPQMFRVSLPSAGTFAIGMLKDTSIASTIGVVELTYRGSLVTQTTFRGLEVFAVVGILYIVMSLPVAWMARVADARLQSKVSR